MIANLIIALCIYMIISKLIFCILKQSGGDNGLNNNNNNNSRHLRTKSSPDGLMTQAEGKCVLLTCSLPQCSVYGAVI